ncbi:SGNH/GDSL hydrolase family protein [Hymenobacter sp. HSC-4F20]|uniref:SGNH/GDSL hydrolase family protein n=1 Tax=Hymenobacter sp. HSC-4F20 TaxID=2864135 RepID=UPI001C7329F4|nr:SGNH/GDSL hydrolase family protein [Hymenobacter sp. HSC-4F20]MBX0290936.1 SGNH/GDSL hydrolase family protein [Hymenobacter sp. HSC-4F20]
MRLLLLLSFFLYFGCTQPASEPAPRAAAPPAPTPAAPPGSVRYLALGDSYTIGQSVPEADRWCVQLAQLGRAEVLTTPAVIAQTGWTTADLLRAIRAANPPATYGLVSLLIGVNNQYQGLPLPGYRTEFRELLQTAVRLAGGRAGRVVVLSIPDWGQSPTGRSSNPAQIAREIDQFNGVARDECLRAGIAFVEITDLTRAASGDATQFASDGLHYSGRQMQQWATRTLPVVRQLLAK